MSASEELAEYAQVTLDVNGTGAVQIGPDKFNESWQIDVCAVNVNVPSASKQSRFTIYKGSSTAITSLVNGTYSGNFDSDTAFNQTLKSGNIYTCVWTGGVPGAVATVVFHGTRIYR